MKRKKRTIEPSRARAVEALKKNYGDDYFEQLGKKPHPRGFSDPEVAKRAAAKRWNKGGTNVQKKS